MRFRALLMAVVVMFLLGTVAMAFPVEGKLFTLTADNNQKIEGAFASFPCCDNKNYTTFSWSIWNLTNIHIKSFKVSGFSTEGIKDICGPGWTSGQWNATVGSDYVQWIGGNEVTFPELATFKFCIPCCQINQEGCGEAIDGVDFKGTVPVPGCKTPVVPEPGTMALFGMGLAPMAGIIRRRRSS